MLPWTISCDVGFREVPRGESEMKELYKSIGVRVHDMGF